MKIRTQLFFVTVTLAALSHFSAADAPPRQIDLNRFPATKLEDVVVPLPSEVFNVLDKLGTPDWRGEMRAPNISSRGARAQIALLLGSVVAEGFVAVDGGDKERGETIRRDVFGFTRAIGGGKTVLNMTNAPRYNAEDG